MRSGVRSSSGQVSSIAAMSHSGRYTQRAVALRRRAGKPKPQPGGVDVAPAEAGSLAEPERALLDRDEEQPPLRADRGPGSPPRVRPAAAAAPPAPASAASRADRGRGSARGRRSRGGGGTRSGTAAPFPACAARRASATQAATSSAVSSPGRGRRTFADLPERGAVVLDGALVDVDARGEEAFRPAANGQQRRRAAPAEPRASAGLRPAASSPAIRSRRARSLLHASEAAAVLDRVGAAAEAVADDVSLLAGLRRADGDRSTSHRSALRRKVGR